MLSFLVEQADMSPAAAYTTFNMGCGFAVYCGAGCGEEVVRLASELGLSAGVAGVVEAGPRRVLLEPVGVVFESGDMDLRRGPVIRQSSRQRPRPGARPRVTRTAWRLRTQRRPGARPDPEGLSG